MSYDLNFTKQITEGLGVTNSTLTVLGTLGIAALVRSAWTRATLSYDQKFLLQLEGYKEACTRADTISHEAKSLESGAERSEMLALAENLHSQAKSSLRYAIAQAKWQNSQYRNRSHGAIIIGLLLIPLGAVLASFQGIGSVGTILAAIATIIAFIATPMGVLFATIGKDTWISKQTGAMRESDPSSAR